MVKDCIYEGDKANTGGQREGAVREGALKLNCI